MDVENIISGNKLIAEFMGYFITDFNGQYNFVCNKEKKPEDLNQAWLFRLQEAKYHLSWDWIMPVVEKIENCFHDGLIFYIKDCRSFIEVDTQASLAYDIGDVPEFYSGFCDTKLEAAYATVVEFIKWYNENKN